MKSHRPQRGYTLLELMMITAIIGILASIALISYQRYMDRARGVSIIEKYDALRTRAHTIVSEARPGHCQQFLDLMDNANLTDEYARLSIGFEAVPGGYRPVLNVCARADPERLGVRASRGAYETMLRSGVVEDNPVITETVVSFAMRLTDDNGPVCDAVPPTTLGSACETASQTAQAQAQPQTHPKTKPQSQPKPRPQVQPQPSGQQPDTQQPDTQQPDTQQPDTQQPAATNQPDGSTTGNPPGSSGSSDTSPPATGDGSAPGNPPAGQTDTTTTPPPAQTGGSQSSGTPQGSSATNTCPSGMRPNPVGHCVPDHRHH